MTPAPVPVQLRLPALVLLGQLARPILPLLGPLFAVLVLPLLVALRPFRTVLLGPVLVMLAELLGPPLVLLGVALGPLPAALFQLHQPLGVRHRHSPDHTAVPELRLERLRLTVTDDLDGDPVPRTEGVDLLGQRRRAADDLPSDLDDDVVLLDSGLVGGRVLHHAQYARAALGVLGLLGDADAQIRAALAFVPVQRDDGIRGAVARAGAQQDHARQNGDREECEARSPGPLRSQDRHIGSSGAPAGSNLRTGGSSEYAISLAL